MRPTWQLEKKRFPPFLCCSVLSEVILFHGKNGVTQERFDDLWRYDKYPPSIKTALHRISNRNVKWYIRNFMQIEDPIWNADFLHGLATCGHIRWNRFVFPSLHWTCHEEIFEMLDGCPFHGVSNKGVVYNYKWYNVPAFYLEFDPESISYMAGILATGKLVERNGEMYADYNSLSYPYLREFNIPIEYESEENLHNLISPFWPALFSKYMPSAGIKWMIIKNAHHANLYASILSRIYVSNKVDKESIPYLKSRRWIYDHYGRFGETEQLWLEMGLSQLDKRIRSVIGSWMKSV